MDHFSMGDGPPSAPACPERRRSAARFGVGSRWLGALWLSLMPTFSWACACGCGMFDIGANTAFPNMSDSGWSAWFRVNYMDQNKNWEGASSAPAADNQDKKIKTWFYTVGGQYMFNHDWGLMVEVPIFDRTFSTTGDGAAYPVGTIGTTKLTALGDMMIQGVYAGFSPDMSTGVTLGIKLPTGDYTGPYVPPNGLPAGNPNSTTGGLAYDRDTLPGTGSTDLLLGGYHVGGLGSDNRLAYFAQGRYDIAVFTRDGATGSYRPGSEADTGVGLTYDLGKVGVFSKVAPLLQVLGSWKVRDSGTAASLNSGYRRLLIGPGVDVRIDKTRVFMDAELPVLQYVKTDVRASGNVGQLTASVIWKMQVAYDF
jgi:hypothetical protein